MSFAIVLLLIVIVFAESSKAALCSQIFSNSSYDYLTKLDSQKELSRSWPSLFRSNQLAESMLIDEQSSEYITAQSRHVIKSLPLAAQEAVLEYSEISQGVGGYFDGINGYLREVVQDKALTNRSLKPSLYSSSVAKSAKAIEQGISLSPSLPKGLILFRGLAIDPALVQENKPFKDFGFVSTSLEPKVAYEFAQVAAVQTGEIPHLFVIEIKTNTVHGLHVTANNEQEILLQRGLDMRVESISERTMPIRIKTKTSKILFRVVHLSVN